MTKNELEAIQSALQIISAAAAARTAANDDADAAGADAPLTLGQKNTIKQAIMSLDQHRLALLKDMEIASQHAALFKAFLDDRCPEDAKAPEKSKIITP